MHNSWIVEGTSFASFRFALLVAQIIADGQNLSVPVVRSHGRDLDIVKIMQPKA